MGYVSTHSPLFKSIQKLTDWNINCGENRIMWNFMIRHFHEILFRWQQIKDYDIGEVLL